nr:PREDICTED: transmembrane protein FLJ37396 [Phalacrocorax carbo]
MEGLQEHVAAVFKTHPSWSSSATLAHASGQQGYDHIWNEIYACTELHQVHSAQFMEFAEMENHDDFHTSKNGYIHTQDQRELYIIYDVALEDLKELENQQLLVASQYIEKDKGRDIYRSQRPVIIWFAVFRLLDVYFEAYQHALDPEERFALAQAITDIMHKCPGFDLKLEYFVNAYKDECICLQLHLQLLRDTVNQQRGGTGEFGLPYNIITKQLISLNTTTKCSLKNIYLLEFHPSLGLVCLNPKALEFIYQEFYSICRPNTASKACHLEKQVLQLIVDEWLTMEKPETFYSSQIQKDLFADRRPCASARDCSLIIRVATLRHRLIEVATESTHVSRFYKDFAMEAGFWEFHLYLRPMHFESASHREKADHFPPIFITSLLQDDSCLLCPSGIRNMQLILACQVIQKNALWQLFSKPPSVTWSSLPIHWT